MGLITKTVIMRWNPKNKEHYESKEYKFTNWKDEFEIKIEDLSCYSSFLVDVQCNCCEKILINMKWKDYKQYVKEDGKYYCQKCAINLYGKENELKTRLHNGKSFEQWCIENDRQDVLDRWDYELNDKKPNKVFCGTNKKYYFKCLKGIHKSELKYIGAFVQGQVGSIDCNTCNSFAQHLIDLYGQNALDLYWDYDKNTTNPWKISYGSKIKVWIKCQEKDYHGSYDTISSNFMNGSRCPYCCNYRGKVHKLDSLETLFPQVLELWSNKNRKLPFEYTPFSSYEVWWKCKEGNHKDYKRKISISSVLNFRCSKCSRERNESILQEKVRLYLNELEHIILHENNCTIIAKNPKTKMLLPYDNEIFELKLIIEVMGLQHDKINSWAKKIAKNKGTTPQQELHYQKLKDRYKRIFAKSQGYFYLDIWYYHDDGNETWKQLINEKINEILSLEGLI